MIPDPPPQTPAPTLIGPWQVVKFLGSGQFGSVCRVVRASNPLSGSFALKLAHNPDDARFEREASLLSRLQHPHVPAFLEWGEFLGPSGRRFPFLVMQEVEGQTLYDWAESRPLTSRAALLLLAQLARALEATHSLGALHRDVKGHNVRVSPSGHLWLLDFGACTFPGAPLLTEGCIPPGTEPYRSPQILLFRLLHQHQPGAHYRLQPADDVFALGATAFRLVTGRYPPTGSASQAFRLLLGPARRALASACPVLRDFILRMLSQDPHARGTSSHWAHELELAARTADPHADMVLVRRTPPEQRASSSSQYAHASWQRLLARRNTLAAVALAALSGLLTLLVYHQPSGVASLPGPAATSEGEAQSLGKAVLTSQPQATKPSSSAASVTAPVPKEPLKGQRRPPCDSHQVEINGGCWLAVHDVTDGVHLKAPCREATYSHDGKCYTPSYVPPRPPTSEPR